MDSRQLVLSQFGMATQILGMIMGDVTAAVARSVPAGQIQPIANIYAHLVADVDFMVNGTVLQKPLLISEGGWSARTGIPIPQSGLMTPEWLAGLNVDLAAAQEYGQAVFAAFNDAIANQPEDVMSREIVGPFGKTTGFGLLATLGIYHIAEHSGEIAALKGVQDLKGLPV